METTPHNGQDKRAKAVTVYVVERNGVQGVELECIPNKAFLIKVLCDALEVAANLEFKKPVIQEPGQFMRLFKR